MMDDLGSDEQKWLDVLRSSDEPSTEDRARVRAAVLASVGGAAAASTGGAAAAGLAKSGAVVKATGAAALFSTGWKIGVAVVSLAVLGTVTATVAMRTTPSSVPSTTAVAVPTPPAPAAAPAPAEATPSSSAEAPTVAAMPTVTTEASARRGLPAPVRAAASHAPTPSDDVDAELALLARAQRALERGDPNGALVDLSEHAHRHPRGALALEREGLRAIASCDAKRGDGRALAERFVRAHPSAPLVGRVRAACLSP